MINKFLLMVKTNITSACNTFRARDRYISYSYAIPIWELHSCKKSRTEYPLHISTFKQFLDNCLLLYRHLHVRKEDIFVEKIIFPAGDIKFNFTHHQVFINRDMYQITSFNFMNKSVRGEESDCVLVVYHVIDKFHLISGNPLFAWNFFECGLVVYKWFIENKVFFFQITPSIYEFFSRQWMCI